MTLVYAKKRYKAARSRALYWSGNPTFTGHRYVVSAKSHSDQDLHYETELCT